jgi:hypothetical protein
VCKTIEEFHLLEELIWFHNEKKITLQCVLRDLNTQWPGIKSDVTMLLGSYIPPA